MRRRFETWVRKIPWRRAWQPTPVFLPGEFHGQMSLVGYIQSIGLQRVGHNWGDSAHTHPTQIENMFGLFRRRKRKMEEKELPAFSHTRATNPTVLSPSVPRYPFPIPGSHCHALGPPVPFWKSWREDTQGKQPWLRPYLKIPQLRLTVHQQQGSRLALSIC